MRQKERKVLEARTRRILKREKRPRSLQILYFPRSSRCSHGYFYIGDSQKKQINRLAGSRFNVDVQVSLLQNAVNYWFPLKLWGATYKRGQSASGSSRDVKGIDSTGLTGLPIWYVLDAKISINRKI